MKLRIRNKLLMYVLSLALMMSVMPPAALTAYAREETVEVVETVPEEAVLIEESGEEEENLPARAPGEVLAAPIPEGGPAPADVDSAVTDSGDLKVVLTEEDIVSEEAAFYATGDDYPYKNDSMNEYDPWMFVKRNCTSFVAWCLNSRNGVAFHNTYMGVRWGGAADWGNVARNLGIPVNNTPAVGAIGWNSFGHVAWVKEVRANSVVVDEYNWDGDGKYHEIERANGHYSGFIHIKDIGSTPSKPKIIDFGVWGFPSSMYCAIISGRGNGGRWIHTEVNSNREMVLAASNQYTPEQIWHFVKQPDGTYTIKNEYNGMYLGLEPGKEANYVKPVFYDNANDDSRKWYVIENPVNQDRNLITKYLYDRNKMLVLDVNEAATAPGTKLQIFTQNGTEAQAFSVYSVTNAGKTYVKPAAPDPVKPTVKAEYVSHEERENGLILLTVKLSISWPVSPLKGELDKRIYQLSVHNGANWRILTSTEQTSCVVANDSIKNLQFYNKDGGGPWNISVRVTAKNTRYYSLETMGEETVVNLYGLIPSEEQGGGTSVTAGWKQDANGRRYLKGDGTYAKNEWLSIDGKYYLFSDAGYMMTGWVQINDSLDQIYYLGTDGAMKTGWVTHDGGRYYLGSNGAMLRNRWIKADGKDYYLQNNGRAATGKVTIDGIEYTFDSAGVLVSQGTAGWNKDSKGYWYRRADGTYPKSKWERISGKWYYFDKSGYMKTGWQKIDGKWYYLGGAKDGAMKTGWQKIGGKWYYFNSSGAMLTGWQKISNKWYYFAGGGAMQTGWQKISGKWYYFEGSGAMLANVTKKIGSKYYTFNASGVCTNP